MSLLKLSPELQKDLVTGVRKVEHVPNMGKLSPGQQKKKADEPTAPRLGRRRQNRRSQLIQQRTRAGTRGNYHAVIIPGRRCGDRTNGKREAGTNSPFPNRAPTTTHQPATTRPQESS